MTRTGLPLDGVRVVEMTHMVMGPTCGMILAQLGAEVIKVEPPAGDKTRSLGGMGTSFFPLFNRGKKSVVLDFAKAEDRETMDRLLASAEGLHRGLQEADRPRRPRPGVVGRRQVDRHHRRREAGRHRPGRGRRQGRPLVRRRDDPAEQEARLGYRPLGNMPWRDMDCRRAVRFAARIPEGASRQSENSL